MSSVIASEKLRNQIVQNNNLVKALNRYVYTGRFDSDRAKRAYLQYAALQAKLKSELSYTQYKHFTFPPIRVKVQKSETCEICGYPVTSNLTKHHIIMKCKGGEDGPITWLCPNCHCAIHRSVNRGTVDIGIIQYLERIDGAIEKFGMYVRMCVEA